MRRLVMVRFLNLWARSCGKACATCKCRFGRGIFLDGAPLRFRRRLRPIEAAQINIRQSGRRRSDVDLVDPPLDDGRGRCVRAAETMIAHHGVAGTPRLGPLGRGFSRRGNWFAKRDRRVAAGRATVGFDAAHLAQPDAVDFLVADDGGKVRSISRSSPSRRLAASSTARVAAPRHASPDVGDSNDEIVLLRK